MRTTQQIRRERLLSKASHQAKRLYWLGGGCGRGAVGRSSPACSARSAALFPRMRLHAPAKVASNGMWPRLCACAAGAGGRMRRAGLPPNGGGCMTHDHPPPQRMPLACAWMRTRTRAYWQTRSSISSSARLERRVRVLRSAQRGGGRCSVGRVLRFDRRAAAGPFRGPLRGSSPQLLQHAVQTASATATANAGAVGAVAGQRVGLGHFWRELGLAPPTRRHTRASASGPLRRLACCVAVSTPPTC